MAIEWDECERGGWRLGVGGGGRGQGGDCQGGLFPQEGITLNEGRKEKKSHHAREKDLVFIPLVCLNTTWQYPLGLPKHNMALHTHRSMNILLIF